MLHTPGHAPGAVCLYVPSLGCVFTGDTLFEGGPGATGRSYSDADLIKESIRARLFALPDDTVVHTGHGPDTTHRRGAGEPRRLTQSSPSAVCSDGSLVDGIISVRPGDTAIARRLARWPEPQHQR